ncbi:MAG TPA: thiamine-phosphate kinase [Steroidobacteraceae bacterium]|nr:thiamine-phosphate kinase [Steroidobacteraceae bacterium]
MPIGEFELIERYFADGFGERDDVVLGVGDDAALVRVPEGFELVVAADTLVAGVHFPEDLAAEHIGYRVLAVNLSDLAAMGAAPAWCTLALTLPQADEGWLGDFNRGFRELAVRHRVALIGGDTTHGPLTLTLQILGLAPVGSALRRGRAHAGDLIFTSGTPGDAAAGLELLRGPASERSGEDQRYLAERFLTPIPRVELGQALRGVATAAIDVSDGLHADLGKLLGASAVGGRLELASLPISEALLRCVGPDRARELALGGGDDYELCFTAPAERRADVLAAAVASSCPVREIGVIEKQRGLRCFDRGREVSVKVPGYDHFEL